MLETVLSALHGTAILALGISMAAAFAGIRRTKRNILIWFVFFLLSNGLQITLAHIFSETIMWKLYPLIVHLPVILLLCFVYRKPLATALAATFTSYLCCQPSKWIGAVVAYFTNSAVAETSARILCQIPVVAVALCYLAPFLSEIFSKDMRSVYTLSLTPTIYYIFDYVTVVYTDLWFSNVRAVIDFQPFLLSVMYVSFCFLYYKEYEEKADAQRREQIVGISVKQQEKEIKAVKQIEQEIRLLRHDMRMLLSSLAMSIENGDTDTARELINAQISRVDGAMVKRFCGNDIVNYVIADYSARCKHESIPFFCTINIEELTVDEIMFCSILSNALDNALNAQKLLPPDSRSIKLMLKNSQNKLLLSVKNPVNQKILFSDGLPVSHESGHGYGVQSIRYLTERLGGNCLFSVQDDVFIMRVVL